MNSSTSHHSLHCQICEKKQTSPVLRLGYLPPVNMMQKMGEVFVEKTFYPTDWYFCQNCRLAQLGCVVDAEVLFPKSYPYTSSTTKALKDNFDDLFRECRSLFSIDKSDLIVDIGSNDGNLLSFFKENCKVLGITPEKIGELAIEKGIPTLIRYFDAAAVAEVLKSYGTAQIITATNVFAHIDKIHVS